MIGDHETGDITQDIYGVYMKIQLASPALRHLGLQRSPSLKLQTLKTNICPTGHTQPCSTDLSVPRHSYKHIQQLQEKHFLQWRNAASDMNNDEVLLGPDVETRPRS